MTGIKLTKYETARIIGSRANLLGRGSPPMIDIGKMINIIEIATAEFEQNRIPFVLVREMPNGTKQKIVIGRGLPPMIKE